MPATGMDVFDSTVQQTNIWLNQIMDHMGWEDRQRAYLGLRGTLHALRDHLTVDEGAHLSAQLPMLIRGIYYESWNPSKVPVKERDRDAFLQRVGTAFDRMPPTDPEMVARAVLRVLTEHVSEGETADIRQMLPKSVRALMP